MLKRNFVLSAAVAAAVLSMPTSAATEAERIQQLERQLKQQQEVLQLMQQELQQLKSGKPEQTLTHQSWNQSRRWSWPGNRKLPGVSTFMAL